MSLDHQPQTRGHLLVQSCAMKMRLSLGLVDLVAEDSEKLGQVQQVGFELPLTRTEVMVSAIDRNPCPAHC
jgi:hypothetical protein